MKEPTSTMPPRNLDLGMTHKELIAALVEAAELGVSATSGIVFAAWERRRKAIERELLRRLATCN